jgi:hypothetical protein
MRVTAGRIQDREVQVLAALAGTMKSDYAAADLAWKGSPFAWIRQRPSRQRGKIGEMLVAGWCAAKGLDVTKAPDSECDRIVEGVRTEIKFSTPWESGGRKSGGYRFQQFRDQDYKIAICLGVSPFDAHCWIIPKRILKKHVIGHTGQHGGSEAKDTAWLHVDPSNPHPWLSECGGRLSKAFGALKRLTKKA